MPPCGAVSFYFGRLPLHPSALPLMDNRTYLRPLQISLLSFAFSIWWAVIWYGWGHWQLFLSTVTWRWQWERCSWFCVRVCVFQNNPMPPLSAYWPTVPTTSALANPLVQHLPIPWITFSLYNWIRNCMWVSCFYSDCCHQLLLYPNYWFWCDSSPERLLVISFSFGLGNRMAKVCAALVITCMDLLEHSMATAEFVHIMEMAKTLNDSVCLLDHCTSKRCKRVCVFSWEVWVRCVCWSLIWN